MSRAHVDGSQRFVDLKQRAIELLMRAHGRDHEAQDLRQGLRDLRTEIDRVQNTIITGDAQRLEQEIRQLVGTDDEAMRILTQLQHGLNEHVEREVASVGNVFSDIETILGPVGPANQRKNITPASGANQRNTTPASGANQRNTTPASGANNYQRI